MSRKSKKSVTKNQNFSTNIMRTFTIVLAIALSMASVLVFSNYNSNRISNLNKEEITENTERLARDLDAFLKTRQEIIGHLSRYYSQLIDSDNKIDKDILKDMEENSCFDIIGYADADGWEYGVDGRITNAHDREYYKNGILGNSGVETIYDSRVSDGSLLMVYSPVYCDGEVAGVLSGAIRTTGRIAELLDVSNYRNKAEIYLCDPDGNIFAESQSNDSVRVNRKINAIDFFKDEPFFDEVKNLMETGSDNSFAGKSAIGCVMRTPKSDWKIVSIYPEDAHNNVVRESTSSVYNLLVVIFIIFIWLVVVLLLTNHKDHKVAISSEEKQKKELESRFNVITEQLSILDTLSRDTKDICIINMVEKTSKIIKANGVIKQKKEQVENPYRDMWEIFAEKYIAENERKDVLENCSLEKVAAELENKDEYSFTLRFKIGDKSIYGLAKYTVMQDNKDMILFALYNIEAQVREEIRQKEMLKDALYAAECANIAKTDFLNNMSHDIRTPMNAIVGFSTLAEMNINNTDKVSEYLSKIRAASNHLLDLINEILDMSRIEAGKTQIEESENDLQSIVDDICTISQPTIKEKQLNFCVDTSGIVNKNIVCDRLHLSQVLLNIITNAIKYTNENGSVGLRIFQNDCADDGFANYSFTVKDNGVGMSKDFQERLFEPFERERTSTECKVQGTGLGMSICKQLVDMMGGTIVVESEVGEGTEITVNLTFKICETDESTVMNNNNDESLAENSEACEKSIDGVKILLVEDNPLNQEIAKEILIENNFIVDVADNGAKAVEIMADSEVGQYDAILMDIQMPIMNGYEATKKIRAMDNQGIANIPIIAMTANAFEEDKNKTFEAGMNDYIAKPIVINILIDTIIKALNNKS